MSGVVVFAPGTASNIGPGFDCLGLAFTGMGDTVKASRVEAPGVRVVSVSDERIPTDPLRDWIDLVHRAHERDLERRRQHARQIGRASCRERVSSVV